MATFRDCWQSVAMHAGVPDPLLCRAWTQWAYNEFCDRRGWSHLRAQTNFTTLAQNTGTCDLTLGSATVVGTAGADGMRFLATDVGRQFRLSSIPIYTIISVDVAGDTSAVLDRVYAEASGNATAAQVLSAYVTAPLDLQRFLAIVDPINRWKLRWWIPTDYLNLWDPARQSTGNPRLLANYDYSLVPADAGRARYELYPYQTGFATYPVLYYRKPEDLLDDQVIIGPLAQRCVDVLTTGALSRCAMWPGTATVKNPYFSPNQIAPTLRATFEDQMVQITVQDENLFFEGLPLTQFGYADFPWDAAWLQSHEPYMIG